MFIGQFFARKGQQKTLIFTLRFLYIYELCYITNPAWSNFLYLGLDFSDFEVGMLYTVGTVLGTVQRPEVNIHTIVKTSIHVL